jgi:hypothetical protein
MAYLMAYLIHVYYSIFDAIDVKLIIFQSPPNLLQYKDFYLVCIVFAIVVRNTLWCSGFL